MGSALLARLVQGLGAGALNLTLSVVVAHGFPPRDRPRAMALVSFCWLLPAFVGPPFAAWLTHYSWRLVFASMIPLVVVALLITLPGVRHVQARFEQGEDEGASRRRVADGGGHPRALPDPACGAGPRGGARRASVCAVAGVLVLGPGLPRILAPAARGIGPGVPSVVLSRAIQAGSFFAAETILLVTLQDLRGYTTFQVGWALTVGSIGWTIGLRGRAVAELDAD